MLFCLLVILIFSSYIHIGMKIKMYIITHTWHKYWNTWELLFFLSLITPLSVKSCYLFFCEGTSSNKNSKTIFFPFLTEKKIVLLFLFIYVGIFRVSSPSRGNLNLNFFRFLWPWSVKLIAIFKRILWSAWTNCVYTKVSAFSSVRTNIKISKKF